MNCISYLSKLLADFVYLQYKFHCLHADMPPSPVRMRNHEFFNDIYTYFGDDNIDRIKERIRILGGMSPISIYELSQITEIKELTSIPDMKDLLILAIEDLALIEEYLTIGINLSGEKNDLITQSKLIEFADTIGTFKRKLSMCLPLEHCCKKEISLSIMKK